MADIGKMAPVRIYKQGKQISQMISYMWRWADDDPQKEETQNARQLKKYFEPFEKDSIEKSISKILSASNLEFEVSSLIENQENQVINQLSKNLFGADPKDWLINNPDQPVETAPEEIKLLIAVFGKERIEDEKKYLSPLFNSNELRAYKFILNPDSFRGVLEDPTRPNDPPQFYIAYPPAPKFGEATVTENQLESWINNDDNTQMFPSNIFIPVSTS